MDRLGSRCPLPGYPRPSVLLCLLILTASFLTYPMLRTLSLQLHSAVTGSYVSGTYSIVFVNCPNEQIARDIASYAGGESQEQLQGMVLAALFSVAYTYCSFLETNTHFRCGAMGDLGHPPAPAVAFRQFTFLVASSSCLLWFPLPQVLDTCPTDCDSLCFRAILDKKLAASVNILPKASSLYFWNGEIEEATEILLLIKTKTSKVRMLSSYVRLVHPFEIPEVFSLPMDQGDVHYLKWLEEGMEED